MVIGLMIVLGVIFPSREFERTNKTLSLLNVIGVVALLIFSVAILGSLCLYCTGFYLFSIFSLFLFWKYGIDGEEASLLRRWAQPSMKYVATSGLLLLLGAYGFAEYTDAKQDAQSGGVAARVVQEFYNLEPVEWPSYISPYWTVQATEEFEAAAIRIVEYGDLLCSDCLYMYEQLKRLKDEFAGKVNIAYQMFPLEAQCNDVVEKDLHPGACDVSLMALYDPDKFLAIHDEVYENFRQARYSREWQAELAVRFDVEAALSDSATMAELQRQMQTGKEYERTHEEYSHGIRSTPTMIINNRMIIGTLPYEQLRAIFKALVEEAEGEGRFIENWVDTGP
jgi:protein-disulfide isomerase